MRTLITIVFLLRPISEDHDAMLVVICPINARKEVILHLRIEV